MNDQPAGKSTPKVELATAVEFLKHVGPRRAELLNRLELITARDLLFCFPRNYEQLGEQRSIDELEEGLAVTLVGEVAEIQSRRLRAGRQLLIVVIDDGSGLVRCLWFNQPFLRDRFSAGQRLMVSGDCRLNDNGWEISHPRFSQLADDEEIPAGRILPVYPLTEGLSQYQLRRIVADVVEQLVEEIQEVFPETMLAAKQLIGIQTALRQIHAPDDQELLEQARRRFIYQEFLSLQLALALRRWSLRDGRQAPVLTSSEKVHERILARFPFQLTAAQQQVIAEISDDLQQSIPMNRLLQGDVGSGKTVVAEYAMLLAVTHGHQAALMAPTEILALQHMETLQQDLAESRVRIGLLTGSLSTAERRQTLELIAAGEIDLVIGTHALGHEDVRFQSLGLVVIDEQHKFGVQQRAMLKKAGQAPHYLVMTATPIPRTVSMALFGDLDISLLETGPGNQQPVTTTLAGPEQRDSWWEQFRQQLLAGRQGYVITPLVDAASDEQLAGVEQTFESLANGELAEFRLGLVHGRLPSEQKKGVMREFADGTIQVLVATSVVEVGINVPNATVMTIEDGQRFGLAQLHQLRGRIRRGQFPGELCVFAEPTTDQSRQRLEALAATTDGFELAEVDFKLRGPGDLFSTRQHGLPPFRIARLPEDFTLLEEARQDARQLLDEDPGLRQPALAMLRRRVLHRYGSVLDLGDVG